MFIVCYSKLDGTTSCHLLLLTVLLLNLRHLRDSIVVIWGRILCPATLWVLNVMIALTWLATMQEQAQQDLSEVSKTYCSRKH